MIKSSDVLNSKLSAILNSKRSKWDYANSILYEMCEKKPLHDDADIIVGKIWLIGRSYAAAIERRKNKDDTDDDDFYYEIVAPKMLSIGNTLDERITELKQYPVLSEENLDLVLNTHKLLTDAFFDITELEKRSLASKYLHFHCPQMFFIYDSRANLGVRKWVKLDKQRVYKHYPCGCDVEYADFCVRMIELQEYCKQKFGYTPSPRKIDDFLLYSK